MALESLYLMKFLGYCGSHTPFNNNLLGVDQLDEVLAAHLGSLVVGEVAVSDEPCTDVRIAPGSPSNILSV